MLFRIVIIIVIILLFLTLLGIIFIIPTKDDETFIGNGNNIFGPTFKNVKRSYEMGPPEFPIKKINWFPYQSISKNYPSNVITDFKPNRFWNKPNKFSRWWPNFGNKKPIKAPPMKNCPYIHS